MLDLPDQPLIDVETDPLLRPLRSVLMEFKSVDGERDAVEVVDDRPIAERVDAHADRDAPRSHVTPEDLENADLARPFRAVLVADHPQRDHVRAVRDRSRPALDKAVHRRVEDGGLLRFPDNDVRSETVLSDWAADRTSAYTGLE